MKAYARLRRVHDNLKWARELSGMPLDKIAATMEKGWAARWAAIGGGRAGGDVWQILHETGAVDQIAVKILRPLAITARTMRWLAGLICALPLFFEVAIVLLISVAFSMARHTGTNTGEAGHSLCLRAWRQPRLAFLLRACAVLLASPDITDFVDDPDWAVRRHSSMIIAGHCGGILSAATLSCVF